MEYVCERATDLRSVADFCQQKGLTEEEFYAHFEDLHALDSHIWEALMEKSIETTISDPLHEELSAADKLLSLYYVFFENLSLNEKFILISLVETRSVIARIKLWKALRKVFRQYIHQVISSRTVSNIPLGGKIEEFRQKAVDESFYLQFAFLVDFWQKDDSPDREKTDAAIEKTVRASMDLLDIQIVDSVFDWARFVWKEKIAKNWRHENS